MEQLRIISWNCRGINNSITRRKLRSIIRDTHANFICLQETKCDNWNTLQQDSIWDSKMHGWITVDSVGLSGGLAMSWDTSVAVRLNHTCNQNWIWFHGALKSHTSAEFYCVASYMPHKKKRRRQIWQDLRIMQDNIGESPLCIIGDFNCILSQQDHSNCLYRDLDTVELQEFMAQTDLGDVPIHKGVFTWFGPGGRCSRLDRVLINHTWRVQEEWSLISKGRKSSDHFAILLSQNNIDWGFKPFKVFNAWLGREDFLKMISDHWDTLGDSGYSIHGKLKSLRYVIKKWYHSSEKLEDKIKALEAQRDSLAGSTSHSTVIHEIEGKIQELYREQDQILRQKAKLDWDSQGDGNTKFFHRVVQYKIKQNHIRGLLHEEKW